MIVKKEKNAYLLLGDMLACGLENGAIWILHHITLDPVDEIPYKHSSTAVNKIVFTRCAEYMAYAVRKFYRLKKILSFPHSIVNDVAHYATDLNNY